MKCKYAREETMMIWIRRVMCSIKQQDKISQLKVYQALFKKGLERTVLNNACPVANGRWNECPFFEDDGAS